nr:MAG TPA: hypothetical protein [Caudoviricetes sp.]
MKGYKGFRKGLICKGKQYAENTVFEEEAVICENGMHFCKNPFDVLDYYGFVDEKGSMNEFAEVEALAETYTNDNKKYCTTKLKVGAKLSFAGFVKTCVDFVLEKTTVEIGDVDENKICSSGYSAQIGSSGNSAKIGSSGNYAQIGSSGNYAKIGSSGNYAQIGSSGDSAQIDSTGEDSLICCAGHNSTVKAKKGSWITLSEWEYSEEKKRVIPLCVKTEYVDGERIKADTFYRLVKGEFKEVN